MEAPSAGLTFDWDRANTEHIARHGVRPAEAEQALGSNPLDVDYRLAGGEQRWTSIGHTARFRVLIVVWMLRESAVRVVTAYPASRSARQKYWSKKGSP